MALSQPATSSNPTNTTTTTNDSTDKVVTMTTTMIPSILSPQQVALLKTALALVVVKRRCVAKREERHRSSNTSINNKDTESTTTANNPLCPWMTDTINKNGSSSPSQHAAAAAATTTLWAHLDHIMGLAVTKASTSGSGSGSTSSSTLDALTMHVAHQLTNLLNQDKHNDSSSAAEASSSSEDASTSSNSNSRNSNSWMVQEWMQATLKQTSPDMMQSVCTVWHGILEASSSNTNNSNNNDLVAVTLLRVLVPLMERALLLVHETGNASILCCDLMEHAMAVLASTTDNNNSIMIQQVLDALAVYLLPVSLSETAACFEWNKRNTNATANSSSCTAATAANNLMLRLGVSSILQRFLRVHNEQRKKRKRDNTNMM